MTLLRTTMLIVVAVIGCSRQNENAESDGAKDQSGDIATMDPNDILFSTPTLNDAIPATLAGSTVGSDCIQLHEDDWRQFEFISAGPKREIDAELTDIATIWDKKSVPLGDSGTAFREVHVRKRIPNPLRISMPLADFEALVGRKTSPMTFFDYDEVLLDVHAVQIDKLLVYAQLQDGQITTIGLDAPEQFTLPSDFLDRLSTFIQKHNLMLVHWRSRTLLKSHGEILAYLGASA